MGLDLPIRISATNAVAEAAEAARREIRGVAEEAGEASSESEGFFEKLKGGFGRGSTLFETAHLLEGGGALIGAKLALHAISEEFDAIGEAAKGAAGGELTAGQAFNKIAENVPIVGMIYKGLESIGGALAEIGNAASGETARVTQAVESQKQWKESLEESEKAAKSAEQAYKSLIDRIAQSQGKDAGDEEFVQRRQQLLDQNQKDLEAAKKIDDQLRELHKQRDLVTKEPGNTQSERNDKTRRVSVIDEDIAETEKKQHEMVLGANELFDREMQRVDADEAKKKQEAKDKQAAEAAKKQDEANQKLLDAQAQYQADKLKQAGEAAKAEEVLAARERDKKKKEIDDAAKQAGNSPAAADAQKSAEEGYQARVKEAREKEAQDRQRAQEEKDRKTKEAADKDKRDANERAREFHDAQRRLEEDAKAATPRHERSSGLAEADDRSHLTGVADASRSRAEEDPSFKELQSQTKIAQDQIKLTAAIRDLLAHGQLLI